jgi:hypothetical protein
MAKAKRDQELVKRLHASEIWKRTAELIAGQPTVAANPPSKSGRP